MGKYNKLYDAFMEAKITRERNNINGVLEAFEQETVKNLNKRYADYLSDPSKASEYNTLVHNLKSNGIRVLRNPNGEHKLIITEGFVIG